MTPTPGSTATADSSAAVADPGATFHHGAISRFNAWFFTAFARYLNHVARHHKRSAFHNLQGATGDRTVVEIGAGTGANLAYLPPGATLIAVEPSLAMHSGLRQRCQVAGVDLRLLPSGAEQIPLPDASVDEVIASLVLCTVPDPARALAEVRRVLRPGGRFRFVEHIAAPPDSLRRGIQHAVRRPWGWLFEGCHPDRDTLELVAAAGFSHVHTERRKFRHSAFYVVNTAAWGVAVK